MNQIYRKLISMALALILSVAVMAMSSYAWLVLSRSPSVEGIQIAIGGGNTILTAVDVQEVAQDGTVYHYPGVFSDKLNFGMQEGYQYLRQLGSLTPVSTYDGLNWFLPDYYTASDKQVQQGQATAGQLKETSDFILDDSLAYANLPAGDEKIRQGSYLYLDFWVVSPGADYDLRVSTGDESNGGSFVIDLPQPKQAEGTYVLEESAGKVSTAVRVGFLANENRIMDNETMLRYTSSRAYDPKYTSLQGVYAEQGQSTWNADSTRFTIYEPNGDAHPFHLGSQGSYVPTKPLARVEGAICPMSVWDRITVQRASSWIQAENGQQTLLSQIFGAAISGKNLTDTDAASVMSEFYGSYLQGQLAQYVQKGRFISKSWELARTENQTSQALNTLQAGATEDVFIVHLQQNVPQRIRMFVWLEGQDMDCIDSANSASFAVNIELAGGSK